MNDKFKEIKLDNITISYKDTIIFDNLNLTFPNKGCICFFGPSGCGKTTLLSIISGLKQPLKGQLNIQGIKPNLPKETKQRSVYNYLKIAYVFQENRLIPWLTALENVSLVLEKETAKAKAEEWLERLGLPDALNKYPSQLSGGMRQRVNIARALAFDAPVILLDEPFKGLDEKIKLKIIDILNELKKDRLLILVSHDQEDISLLADKVISIPID